MADLDKTGIETGQDAEASQVTDLYDALTGAQKFDNVLFTPQQVVTVAKAGGQYTSIQSAIDSITDAATNKIYTVLVYPGRYIEDITLKNYVNIVAIDVESTQLLGSITDNGVECSCYVKIYQVGQNKNISILNSSTVLTFEGRVYSSAAYAFLLVDGNYLIKNSKIQSTNNGINIMIDQGALIVENSKLINSTNYPIESPGSANVKLMNVWSNNDISANITNLITDGFHYDTDVE